MLPCHSPEITDSKPAFVDIQDPLARVKLLKQELPKHLPQHKALRTVSLRRHPFDMAIAESHVRLQKAPDLC